MLSAGLLFSSRTGWGHWWNLCIAERCCGLAQVPVSLLRFHCLALAVWFLYKFTPIPLQNIKMVKEAVVSGTVKPQRMQVTNKQTKNTCKGIWLKVQGCFEVVWRDMGTEEYRATAKETLGIPPSDALETVQALTIKLVAERQIMKPHAEKKKKNQSYLLGINWCVKRSSGLPGMGESRAFFPSGYYCKMAGVSTFTGPQIPHFLSLLPEFLNSNKSRKLTFLKIPFLPILR